MSIIIPEFVFLRTIKAGLSFIKKDFDEQAAKGVEKNSYLYRILEEEGVEKYSYFEQAKSILFKGEDDPRLLTVDLMYNMTFDKLPSIYVSLSGEQHGQNNLAVEQDEEPYLDIDNATPPNIIGYVNKYTRRKNSTYSFYVVSDNSTEANLIYHIIDCLIMSFTPYLAIQGIYNITQGGQDIQLETDKIPKNIFVKALQLGFQYSKSSPDIRSNKSIKDVLFEGKILPTT